MPSSLSASVAAITILLAATGFGESLLAQPRSPVSATPKVARGVALSELSTFTNREGIVYEIMPFGGDFFVATVESEASRGRGFANVGTLDELLALRLYRYDGDLRRADALQVPWPDEPREHISLTTVGEHFAWTYATLDPRTRKVRIGLDILDGEARAVATDKVMDLEARDYRRGRLDYRAAFTPSRSHYVRVYAEQSENRLFSKRDDEAATATILVVDDGGAIVSNKRVRLNANRDQLNVEAVSVDSEGRAYVLARVFDNERGRERRRGGSDATLWVYTLEPGGDRVERTEVELQGQYIQGVGMVPNDAGAPSIVGLYSERVNREIAGYFSGADVTDGTTLRPRPFTREVLEGMGRKITRGRGDRLAVENQFEFRDALRLSDGRLALLMESFDIRVSNPPPTAGGGFQAQRITYVYGEGVVFDFDADGTLRNALVVPKLQQTQTPNLSYARMNLVEYEGNPAVVYNDNPKNFTRSVDRRTKGLNWSKSLAVLGYGEPSARASDGERLRRVPLFARRDADKVIAIPPSVTRLPDGRVVFLATRYKLFGQNQLRFGVIGAER